MMSVTLQRYGKTNYMVGDMKLMVYLLLVYTSMETINIAKTNWHTVHKQNKIQFLEDEMNRSIHNTNNFSSN